MNILFYCDEYPPAKNGGIGTATKLVAEELVKRGHSVYVIGFYPYKYPYLGDKIQPYNTIINGVKVYSHFYFDSRFIFKHKIFRLLNYIIEKTLISHFVCNYYKNKMYEVIDNFILNNKIDIVEFPDYIQLYSKLKLKTDFKKHKIPTVVRIHGSKSFIEYYSTKKIKNSTKNNDINHIKLADIILSVSIFSSNFIISKLNINNDIKVIYNPINENCFKHDIIEANESTPCQILFFGKAKKEKGVHSLILAFNRISEHYPFAKLVIAGDGDIEKVKELIAPHAQKNVSFLGFVNKDRIFEEIDSSSFCVLPSYFENFSMAALEVMARGKALIYTKESSGYELITEYVNGLLVNPYDINDIYNKICFLINNKDIRKKIALNGYHTCLERFSTNSIANQLELEYYKLI